MRRPRALNDAATAFTLLSIAPLHAEKPEPRKGADVAGWFPFVGLALGAVGYGIAHLAEWARLAPGATLMSSVSIVVTWAVLTRLLHWDGLADVADGYWGSHDQQRRLEIMSDSHIGAFGAAAIGMALLLEVAAIFAIISEPHQLPLLVVPMFARLAATFSAWLGTPAKPGGLGRSVMGRPTVLGIAPVVIAVAASVWALALGYPGWWGILFGVGALVLAAGVPHALSRRFGGVTGDVMGASVLITEVLLFSIFAIGM